jgi:hypothetical protein
VILEIQQQPLDLARIVCLRDELEIGSRYQRYQLHTVITSASFSLGFHGIDLPSGGAPHVFAYPKYGLLLTPLLVDGTLGPTVERAVCGVAANTSAGVFSGTLGDEPDGPVLTQIVGYDASGKRVDIPAESFPQYWIFVDRHGEAKNHPFVIFQNASFEWTHGVEAYQYVIVPKSKLIATTSPPLRPRGAAQPWSHMVTPEQLTRRNYHPFDDTRMTPRRPSVTSRGIVVTEQRQAYFWDQAFGGMDPSKPRAELPQLDGPRGYSTAAHTLALKISHTGLSLHGCSAFGFWFIDKTGAKRTLVGLRHKQPGYWNERGYIANDPLVEYVGKWDADVPMHERFALEAWAIAWDQRSFALDESATIGSEHPHVSGPVVFLPDRHGYVLKITFNGRDPKRIEGITADWEPPTVKRFIKANDPWGTVCHEGVVYVNERGLHRTSKWNADTGAYLGNEIESPPVVATLGAIGTDRVWHGAGAETCRQFPIVAPEGLEIFQLDGVWYIQWASYAQGEVRRKPLGAGPDKVQVVCRPAIGGNSRYITMSPVSDGRTGPAGSFLATTWDNGGPGGRPMFYYPAPHTEPDGTALTHRPGPAWTWWAYDVTQGPGNTEVQTYAEAVTLAPGIIVCASAEHGVAEFTWRRAEDGPDPDYAKAQSGGARYRAQYALLHGANCNGYVDVPLPWGKFSDVDYFMRLCGCVPDGEVVTPPTPPTPPTPTVPNLISNGSFESPALPAATFKYAAPATSWTLTGGAGIAANGSGFSAPVGAGAQVAFLQNTGTITQSLTLPANEYVLSFNLARRTHALPAGSVQTVRVLIPGVLDKTLTPPASGWQTITLPFSLPVAGTYSLQFSGAGSYPSGTDVTAFIDAVSLISTEDPAVIADQQTRIAALQTKVTDMQAQLAALQKSIAEQATADAAALAAMTAQRDALKAKIQAAAAELA